VYNSHTFFGTDGSLVVSDQNGLDAGIFTNYFGENGVVGMVSGVTVLVTTEIKAHYVVGSRAPKELRSGNIAISGSVDRAYINGAMLKLMLGKYAESEEAAGFVIPSFNMKLILDNLMPPGDPGNSIMNLFGVMFDSWQVALPEDDFMLEHLSFKARRVAITDNEIKTS
jgi:hypothetical protein